MINFVDHITLVLVGFGVIGVVFGGAVYVMEKLFKKFGWDEYLVNFFKG